MCGGNRIAARGEQRTGQIEATIYRCRTNTKAKRRALLIQEFKTLPITKESTQCDAWNKYLSYRAITEEEKKRLIKGQKFNEYLDELEHIIIKVVGIFDETKKRIR